MSQDPHSVGFADFVAVLIVETLDSIVAAHTSQEERMRALDEALDLSVEDFAATAISDEVLATALIQSFPDGKGGTALIVGGPVPPDSTLEELAVKLTGSDVEVLDLKVMYGNGTVDDISVRQVFKAGTSSRVIDLKGGNRQIDKIGVTYVPRGPARIAFLGVPGAAPNWDTLGCKDVGFVVDRDVIKVGRKDGTFKALKLRVKQAPIEIFNLRVVYGNGAKQDINVKAVVKPGTETRPLDLAGKERGIDRVEMIYRSIPSFKGKATVCVDGLQ